MQYRNYGKEGPQISRLGFGVMRLPNHGESIDVDYEASTRLMLNAMEKGINFFDSHHKYHGGNSETAIGKALKEWKGGGIIIQTKTPWYNDEPTEYFEKLLYEALEKLGVDCIDYLLTHSLRMEKWKERGGKFIKFTDWAIGKGLIRHRGFSSHDTPEHIKEFIDTGEFACMLVSYNWLNPQVRDVIAHAADTGMGVAVMNPVGGGTLAVDSKPVLNLIPGAKSAAEIALRYVLATPGVTCALSGMNAGSQLEENLGVADMSTPMTEDESRHMSREKSSIEKKAETFCSGCGYCMPCEHGVDIPSNFRHLNQAKFFGLVDAAKKGYRKLNRNKEGDKSAEACQRCGSCEPKCPIDVPIMDQLEETANTLGA